MILDGRIIADEIYAALAERVRALPGAPRLGILAVGDNPVASSFIGVKTRAAERLGISVVYRAIALGSSTEDVQRAVCELADASDAVIVQLPLPPHIDTDDVLSAIPPEKDVDAIRPGVSEAERLVRAPVALAVEEILSRSGVSLNGTRAAVVGSGRLVGKPVAAFLSSRGADVSVFQKGDSLKALASADIVVLGAGEPGVVHPTYLKRGVVLIDAGTSEVGGRVAGDADPECANVASVFTPVPGGVGPVAVAMIFRNLLDVSEKKSK